LTAFALEDASTIERVAELLENAPQPMCKACERFARALHEAQRLQRLRAVEFEALQVCASFVDFLDVIERPQRWREYEAGVRELGARLHSLLEVMGGSAVVMAQPCPRCLHTKCGPSCSCDCSRKLGRTFEVAG
jgi:hypothetical protein